MGLVSVQAAKNSALARTRLQPSALGCGRFAALLGRGCPGGRISGPVKKREGLQGSVYRYDTFLRLSLEIRTLCGG